MVFNGFLNGDSMGFNGDSMGFHDDSMIQWGFRVMIVDLMMI